MSPTFAAGRLRSIVAGIRRDHAFLLGIADRLAPDDSDAFGPAWLGASEIRTRVAMMAVALPELEEIAAACEYDPTFPAAKPGQVEANAFIARVTRANDAELAALAGGWHRDDDQPCPADAPTEAESRQHFLETTYATLDNVPGVKVAEPAFAN